LICLRSEALEGELEGPLASSRAMKYFIAAQAKKRARQAQ
jgi:hypothetical protein